MVCRSYLQRQVTLGFFGDYRSIQIVRLSVKFCVVVIASFLVLSTNVALGSRMGCCVRFSVVFKLDFEKEWFSSLPQQNRA